jgi:hypothetical protein
LFTHDRSYTVRNTGNEKRTTDMPGNPHAPAAALFALAGLIAGPAHAQRAQGPDPIPARTILVHGCWGDEHGHLSGGLFEVPSTIAPGEPEALGTPNARGFDGGNRLDLVIVGDGYTAAEMPRFHLDADRIAEDFFRYQPFIRYEPYFRVTKVEVVSNESGVDNDPSPGIERDTALGMGYWCNNIERLLCVDVSAARSYAFAGAPDVDQILAIANSDKYGGAGYSSANLGTAAGGNASAVEIAIHEMGHSLGDLADEYTYGGPARYSGPEPSAANLSLLNASQMAAAQTKWSEWLGASISGFDNPVSTYEGGGYSVTGIYRPSNNSMMRSLARPFNLPSAQKLIREFYREVSPIDAAPEAGSAFAVGETVTIVPMRPAGAPLRIEWWVNGAEAMQARGEESVTAGMLQLGPGANTVEVRVIDDTPWVRSDTIRDSFMTDTRVYTMTGCPAYADLNADRVLDLSDVTAFIDAFLDMTPAADLAPPSGVFDLADVVAFIDAFGNNCR